MAVGTLDVRVFWPWDTAVKPIPAGWTRDADFDDRFLQGSDNTFVGAANSGGAHNHTQTGDHTHVGDSHTHAFEATTATCLFTTAQIPGDPPPPNVYVTADHIHAHASATSNPATITYSNDAVTINNADMKPPWVQAIIIKPDDIGQDIPDDAVCFGDSATPPGGFSITDGTGGTSDLDDRFVIGAAPAGVGGGTGGSATHVHTSPVHDHDPDDHEHAAKLCGYASATINCRLSLPLVTARPSRHHNVTLTTKALADVSDVAVTVQTASSEPAYIKLLGIQNTSCGATTPPGVILPFVGAYADLPASGEWILCDGANGTQDCTDRQVKITTSTGEIGDTGGSNTHTHTVTDHKHTHGAHNHPASRVMTGIGYVDTGLTRITRYDHGATTPHFWIVGNAIPTMQDATITLSTDDGRFDYRTVIWVKRVPPPPPPPVPPIRPGGVPTLFIPDWEDTTRPETFQPAEEPLDRWRAPKTRGWSADKCGVTTFGVRVMEDGWGRPCTLHPVRAKPHEIEHVNQERCRHHYGHFAVDSRGWTRPVYCCNPNSEEMGDDGDYREGRGMFYVAGENDPHCEKGNSCGVASMPLPDTFLGFFHSNSWSCGAHD